MTPRTPYRTESLTGVSTQLLGLFQQRLVSAVDHGKRTFEWTVEEKMLGDQYLSRIGRLLNC